MKNVGRPWILTEIDEEALTSGLIAASKWGFPLTLDDIRYIVKSFLDSNGWRVDMFINNMLGLTWTRSFLKRHKLRSKCSGEGFFMTELTYSLLLEQSFT